MFAIYSNCGRESVLDYVVGLIAGLSACSSCCYSYTDRHALHMKAYPRAQIIVEEISGTACALWEPTLLAQTLQMVSCF